MDWVIEFDVSAFIITAIILILFVRNKNYPSSANKHYMFMMWAGLLSSFFDILSIFTITNARQLPLWLNQFINMAFLVSMNAIVFLYYFYIVAMISEYEQHRWTHRHLMYLLGTIDLVLIVSSPFTGWVFYFDEDWNYCSGPLKPVVYGIALLVLVACFLQTVYNRKLLSYTQKACVYLYTISNLLAVIFQFFYPKLLITNFVIALAFMIMYITLQRPEDRFDPLTQLENKSAFLEGLNREVQVRDEFYLLVVKLENLDKINDTIGIKLANSILRKFAHTLSNASGTVALYRIGGAKFVYICRKKDTAEAIIHYVENRVTDGYEVHDMVVQVRARYCLLSYPQHGETSKELEMAIRYCLKKNQSNNVKIIYADEKLLEEFKRKEEIQNIIKRALVEHTFQVYYQPIYNWREDVFDSAEALIRLHDDKYGFISPEEFIPMAEKSGQIVEIGEYVTDEVCRMISRTNIRQYGMKHIHINLSGVQCMQKDLDERIHRVVDKYGIDPDEVCFEITETAAMNSDTYLTEKLHKITASGFDLALDDYGSGFATFGYLMKYPFSIVKFDKEMVWQSTSDEKAAIAMNHVVQMMKELGLVIVAEGVENEEQAKKLENAGCDLFQGFLYAKPMPESNFTTFLSEKSRENTG